MNHIIKTVRHSVKVCKSVAKSGKSVKHKDHSKRRVVIKKLFKGVYSDRIVHVAKKFRNRLIFTSITLAITIIGTVILMLYLYNQYIVQYSHDI